ncbi:MAG: NAD(P)/FAD-dependent oxidoreductase [Dehalococcoidia bacterium]|nr:NAD(P)/FAD-dependent oxidoreductase [Dehalococcoidia bacterium]
MEQYRYVIVGNSAGAMSAARALRKSDNAGSLLMLSEEHYPAYSRPLIAKHLSEAKGVDTMRLVAPEFYQENAIELSLGTRAVGFNPVEHIIKTADGRTIAFERLLLATGSSPVVPPIPGHDASGVFTFTTFDDARQIAAHLPAVERAVIVGGGFIGLSAADALCKRGVEVTVVEMQNRILSLMLDQTASRMVEDAATTSGARVMTSRRVESINVDPMAGNSVTSVTLDDGSRLACEMVIVAVGVRPRTEIAAGVLQVDRGIIVDRCMQTSADDVFACGDACQTTDFVRRSQQVIAVWPNAVAGGAIAGTNMTGLFHEYDGSTTLNALPYFGVTVGSAGIVDDDRPDAETLVSHSKGCYRKVMLHDNIVTGMVFAGDTTRCGLIHTLMKRRTPVGDWKNSLVSEEFGLLSLPEELWRDSLTTNGANGAIM